MRRLSDAFVLAFRYDGILAPLLDAIKRGGDLLLDIGEDFVVISYKGLDVLKLEQRWCGYTLSIYPRFSVPQIEEMAVLNSKWDTLRFTEALPLIKDRVLWYRGHRWCSQREWEKIASLCHWRATRGPTLCGISLSQEACSPPYRGTMVNAW
ncbi:MAG: hypothetical protein M0Z94_01295 [Dehalococcoidales bacterium]|nr:hypothetical protein [Dehalococcoidales bacterium]